MSDDKVMQFLDAIVSNGGISKAAKSLFVTQPYISQTIHNAEKNYGVELLDRNVKPVRLTYAGQLLLDYLHREKSEYSRLKSEMNSLSKYAHGEIVMATNQPLGRYFFPKLLPEFQRKYPEIKTRLIELPTTQAEKLLLTGDVNFFIGMPIYNKKLDYEKISSDSVYVLIPKSSSLFDGSMNYPPEFPYTINALDGENIISIRQDSHYQEVLDHFFIDHGVDLHVVTEVANMDIAAQLAKKQVGCAFVSSLIVSENFALPTNTLNVFKIPNRLLKTDVGITYRKVQGMSDPIQLLIDLTRKNIKPAIF
ncbi:LysR family transcriptional regulator [Companilactobacillus sp. HBUAS59699]|uniref:LysR family transcriptional regulator n=1 Tax=Companilactobacillus sp. HBUAS59699 TaxID=3109358 RepID=UPI002FEE67E1